jgi:hypothetical protein
MLNNLLATFYERDLRKLIDEVNLFRKEEDLWKTRGTVKNSSGNLVLYLIGGLNYFVGTNLAHTGYVRNRDQEFANKGVPGKQLVAELDALVPMVRNTLSALTQEELDAEYPVVFDGAKNSTGYVLVSMLDHLNYHLG